MEVRFFTLGSEELFSFERPPAPPRLRTRRPNYPINTTRRVSPVLIQQAQTHGDRIYEYLAFLRYAQSS